MEADTEMAKANTIGAARKLPTAAATSDRAPDGGPISLGQHAQGLARSSEYGSTPTCQPYLTTKEAACYLRRSVSWLLRCSEIPYLPGRPNLYSTRDLDQWFEQNKWVPKD